LDHYYDDDNTGDSLLPRDESQGPVDEDWIEEEGDYDSEDEGFEEPKDTNMIMTVQQDDLLPDGPVRGR